jgi:glycosyltransferase involved in cell wall biosynthesis
MKSPVITHVLPTIARFSGGPTVGVRRLNEMLTTIMPEATHSVMSGDAAGSASSLDDWQIVHPLLLPGRGPTRLGWTPDLHGALMRRAPALIHIHGLWRHHTWAAARAAVSLGVPYVVTPHGMLEPWALRQSRRKKWLAGALFQERLLRNAACIFATSRMEAENVRAAGYTTAPIAIVPNGVDPPPEQQLAFREAPPAAIRTVIFVSRLHPKKGLLDLVAAWAVLRPKGWRLRLVGPDEGGYSAVVARAIREAGLQECVSIDGSLWGDAKAAAYADAKLFVLPTFSENFGIVIAEALAAGLPVITTTAAPWHELQTESCGWWIEPGPAPLQEALRLALATPRAELAAMGRRGRALMIRRYTWPAVAGEMAAVYRWLLGVAGPPAHLLFP